MINQTASINTINTMAYSDPGKPCLLRITGISDDQLQVSINGKDIEVNVFQCFPWSDPSCFISLRDLDDKEVALIENLNDLDASSRQAVEKALVAAGFVVEVIALKSVEEDFEIRCWIVETSQGTRKFQTRLDDRLRKIPGDGLLIEDVSGDLFYIRNPEKLDKNSKKLLWAFLD